MAYQIYFSNPTEFLRNLIIATLRIKKHAKTITDNETKLLDSMGLDTPVESVADETPEIISLKQTTRKPKKMS